MKHLIAAASLLAIPALAAAQAPQAPAAPAVERREVGAVVMEGIPEVPEALLERLRQYQNMRGAALADWLPDGSGLLIRTRFADTSQFHVVTHPGGARRQITFMDEPVGGGAFPKSGGGEFLFSMDAGGNENDQLYLFDLASGRSRLITDGVTRHGGGLWANTTDAMAFTNIARNGVDYDIYLREPGAAPGEARMIFKAQGAWGPRAFSPDDKQLVIGRYLSANESELHLLDMETGETRQLLASAEGPVAYGAVEFDSRGEGLYYTSDEGTEFKQLRYLDLKHDVSTTLTEDIPWDVGTILLSNNGGTLLFDVNAGGRDELYRLDTQTLVKTRIELPTGILGGIEFHPTQNKVALTLSTSTSPSDVYTYDLDADVLERWTYSETGGLPETLFSPAEIFHYSTFDTDADGNPRRIPALILKPKSGSGPWPVIINIHGGPEGQSRPYFSSSAQFQVNELGAAVIYPNVRGSSGYGKTYLKLDNGMLREDSVRDIGALLDWIERQPELDASRVAVIGGSYGGYMVLASLVHYGDRLAAGISSVGISNFVTFLESTSEYRRDLRRVEYGDERDPEMRARLLAISPTTNAHKITTPLVVAQGYNDPRVPYTESEQIVRVVRENGVPVWYFLAMNEGHGFAKKENRDLYEASAMMFLEKHLLGRDPAAEPAAE